MGHRAPRDPHGSGPAVDDARRGAQSLRRKHDRRGTDARRHVHLPVRTDPGRRRRGRQACRRARYIDVPIHVDAASGGFLAPFCAPDLVWDFRISRVKSINSSGHKFGLAPLGVGWVIWRETADLPDDLVFWVNYLGGNMRDLALNFSRPGGQVVCQYYNFLRLGKEGYRKVHTACYETARYIAGEIEKLGPFEMIYRGEQSEGIPAVCWKMREGAAPGFSLYDLADRLRSRGWQVPAYSLPANCQDTVVQRILVRHGVSRDLGTLLVDDMRRALEFFEKHPVQEHMSAAEASGFHH
ncbi:MAG: pyridoxal-dependent decarboxylase [Pirellulales bacterium]